MCYFLNIVYLLNHKKNVKCPNALLSLYYQWDVLDKIEMNPAAAVSGYVVPSTMSGESTEILRNVHWTMIMSVH